MDTNFSKSENWKDIVAFIREYQWICNFQNTNFFVDGVWENIPLEWIPVLENMSTDELHQLPSNSITGCDWPTSLKHFVKCSTSPSFNIDREQNQINVLELSKQESRGMSPKKQHEVSNLSSFVHSQCRRTNSSHIVDVGSGLGYVGKILSERFGHHVVGLEKEVERVKGADVLQHKIVKNKSDQSDKLLQSREFTLHNTESCFLNFDQLITDITAFKIEPSCDQFMRDGKDNLTPNKAATSSDSNCNCQPDMCSECGPRTVLRHSDENVCMIGLHCCADLTPVMLRYFIRNPNLKSLICLGCCYHKLSKTDQLYWNEFPMSRSLKETLDTLNVHGIMSQFAFRLAAQETRSRWEKLSGEDHKFHCNNVAYRGLLQLFAKQEGIHLIKKRRRVAGRSDFSSFAAYLGAAMKSFEFGNLSNEYVKKKMEELYHLNMQYFKYIEIFTCLQVLLQPVIESLIITDRVAFLKENGIDAKTEALFSTAISPRNVAIVASKN